MKKQHIITSFVITFFLFSSLVSATHLPEAQGIMPDSPLWGLDVAIDKIIMLLQFTPEGKARQGLLVAQERLLEVREMLLKNDTISAQKAAVEHNVTLQEIKISIKSVNDLGQVVKIKIEIEQHDNDIKEIEQEIKVKTKNPQADKIIDDVNDETDDAEKEIKDQTEHVKIEIKTKTGKSETQIEIEQKEIEAEIREGRR